MREIQVDKVIKTVKDLFIDANYKLGQVTGISFSASRRSSAVTFSTTGSFLST
jgi:hypothetical protein